MNARIGSDITLVGEGLEAEGFIIDDAGNGIVRVGNTPTSEWLMQKVKLEQPALVDYLSFEQLSTAMEIKTDVGQPDFVIAQVFSIREDLNKILSTIGGRLSFQPVLQTDFEPVCSTTDQRERGYQLFEDWKKTSEGESIIRATSICSLQINTSSGFDIVLPEKRSEMIMALYNYYSEISDILFAMNDEGFVDNQGNTRMQLYEYLISTLKKDQFEKQGMKPVESVYPNQFMTYEDYSKWVVAHSGVEKIEDADSKNNHSGICKIK